MSKTEIERLTVVETKLDNIDKKLDGFIETADKKYADQATFNIVKSLVFGMAGLILTGVVGAFLALVVK